MTLQSTIQLSPDWDLMTDASGNLAILAESGAVAQDVAAVCRTYIGEAWFDTTVGLPYHQQFLGQAINLPLAQAQFEAAARTVPGVVAATASLQSGGVSRAVTGTLAFIDETGQAANAHF